MRSDITLRAEAPFADAWGLRHEGEVGQRERRRSSLYSSAVVFSDRSVMTPVQVVVKFEFGQNPHMPLAGSVCVILGSLAIARLHATADSIAAR